VDETHEFPICHAPDKYVDNLLNTVPDVRERVDALISDYCGAVIASLPYALYDA